MIKDRVIKAYVFAQKCHENQFRKFSGLPYFSHPKGVARKVEDLTKNEDMVIAGFLHDVVEDCGVKIETIIEMFGDNVGRLVFALTLDKDEVRKSGSKAEYLLQKMLLMEDDELELKLIDRQDNCHFMDKDCKTTEHKTFVKRYSLETRYIIDGIRKSRKNLTKLQVLILDMIDVRLRYIDLKYLW